jgi:F-type H+-transporting ATPase subunit delta
VDPKAVSRYARALFGLADSRGELEPLEKDLDDAKKLVRQHPEISNLVLNTTISQGEKEDFLEKVFPTAFSPLLIDFLKLLVKKRRFPELPFIQEEFHRLYEKKQGIQEVKAITVVPLSPPNQEKLREMLKRKLQCEIRLVTEIDRNLIGGFILRFNGTEINATYKNRLEEIRQKLIRF